MMLKPRCAALLLLGLATASARAIDRDPTQWPAGMLPAAPASAASGADPEVPLARQVLIRDGRAYLVIQGRRYAVGEVIDGVRLHRIDETAIWWNEGGQIRREPLYGGVEKRQPKTTSKEKP
ncbi:hypothetical protein [Roseateles paludis]|uniref:MSHA biogenesis protein MshK n=1 Tax=Roseateles paludis TaxID=3145238 RepID=A0ABV0G7T1_9BURK